MQVTIAATTLAGSSANRLLALRLVDVANAALDLGGQTYAASGSVVTLPPGVQQTTFYVRRVAPGAATIRLIVQDACGDWSTFVGMGVSAP